MLPLYADASTGKPDKAAVGEGVVVGVGEGEGVGGCVGVVVATGRCPTVAVGVVELW